MSETVTTPASIALAKALHYTNQASAMFETVIVESGAKANAKDFLQMQVKRCRAVLNDVNGRLKTSESAAALKQEMKDEYWIDAVLTQLMCLNMAGREHLEAVLNETLTLQSLNKI